MKPIPERIAQEFMREERLNSVRIEDLKYIRKLIVKEFFRFYIWYQLSDRFEDFKKIQIPIWIEYSYKIGSILYQCYFGESRDQLKDEFKALRSIYQDAINEQLEQAELARRRNAKRTANLPKSNDPIYNTQQKELMYTTAGIHFQVRFHGSASINVLDKDHDKDLSIKLDGIDFSLCNPVGPPNVKISLMLKTLLIDTFLRKKDMAKNKFVKRKRGIFEGERGTVRGDLTSKRFDAGTELNKTIFDTTLVPERKKA